MATTLNTRTGGNLQAARGLMELIIINIGLQRGIISPALFAVLVIMAVITTLMASPLFDRLVGEGTNDGDADLQVDNKSPSNATP